MEKKQFDELIKEIDDKMEGLDLEEKAIVNTFNLLKKDLGITMKAYKERLSQLKEYASHIEDLSYSDKLTSPSQTFAGIRTVSDMVNLDDLNNLSNRMDELAKEIDVNTKKIDYSSVAVIPSLQRLLNDISEYVIKENAIYNTYLDFFHKIKSIYDKANFGNVLK